MKVFKFLLLLTPIILASCSKPTYTYCECEDISREAILASVGMPNDYSSSDLLACAEKVKEDMEFDMPAKRIGIDYIQQVSYEMCTYGFYEGRGADRGKKYYPISE